MTVTKLNYLPYEGETKVKYTMSRLEAMETEAEPDLPAAGLDGAR
jgi:hypothetical protein